jgi:hypothetical protein
VCLQKTTWWLFKLPFHECAYFSKKILPRVTALTAVAMIFIITRMLGLYYRLLQAIWIRPIYFAPTLLACVWSLIWRDERIIQFCIGVAWLKSQRCGCKSNLAHSYFRTKQIAILHIDFLIIIAFCYMIKSSLKQLYSCIGHIKPTISMSKVMNLRK